MTLNRALELLPAKIKREKSYMVYGCEENFYKVVYDFGINKKGLGYLVDIDEVLFWERIKNKDYHLAALRLLKKVVEGGYLKVNKTDQSVDFDKVKSTDAE